MRGPGSDCRGPCPGHVMGLKEMRAFDVESDRVFFSDFAEPHEINGRMMDCVLMDVSENEYQRSAVGRTLGLNAKDVERTISRTWTTRMQLFVRARDWDAVCGGRPGSRFKFDLDRNRKMTVTECVDESGVYVISAEENRL